MKTNGRRASPLSADQRRQQIIDVALPLIVKYGTSLTTSQVAKAAKIAEGTIFRVFADKETLLAVSFEQVADSDECQRDIKNLLGLGDHHQMMTKMFAKVRAHLARALPVMQGVTRRQPIDPRVQMTIGKMFGGLIRVVAFVLAALIEKQAVVGDPGKLSRFFVGLCQASVWQQHFEQKSVFCDEEMANLFLHGCAQPLKPDFSAEKSH